MTVSTICVLVSALSFYAYVVSYYISPKMKDEFKRFNVEKLGLLTIMLELFGATGLLVGLKINLILVVSSLGLSLLMLFGLMFRIKFKDSLWISLPALFYMVLNLFIFWTSIK